MTRHAGTYDGQRDDIFLAVTEQHDGRRTYLGPYANRGPATQAMRKRLKELNDNYGRQWRWSPDGEQEWYVEPGWEPAVGWLEKATGWEIVF